MYNLILAFIAGNLTTLLIILICYRKAEQEAFNSFWEA